MLAGRYASGAMRASWAPESKINAERRLWIAVMRAQAAAGLDISDATIAALKAAFEAADGKQSGTGLLPLHALPRLLQDAGVQLTPGIVDEIRAKFTEKGRFALPTCRHS